MSAFARFTGVRRKSGDAVTRAALAVAIGPVLSLIGFWMRYSGRITKAEAAVDTASILANALQVKLRGRSERVRRLSRGCGAQVRVR
jgi:hypothetical protein